eukprot:5408439-Pleurochrysis_carterae.AAC.1
MARPDALRPLLLLFPSLVPANLQKEARFCTRRDPNSDVVSPHAFAQLRRCVCVRLPAWPRLLRRLVWPPRGELRAQAQSRTHECVA